MDLISKPARYHLMPMYGAAFDRFVPLLGGIRGFRGTSCRTGRRDCDSKASAPDAAGSSVDVSWSVLMVPMSRPAQCSPTLMCRANNVDAVSSSESKRLMGSKRDTSVVRCFTRRFEGCQLVPVDTCDWGDNC